MAFSANVIELTVSIYSERITYLISREQSLPIIVNYNLIYIWLCPLLLLQNHPQLFWAKVIGFDNVEVIGFKPNAMQIYSKVNPIMFNGVHFQGSMHRIAIFILLVSMELNKFKFKMYRIFGYG